MAVTVTSGAYLFAPALAAFQGNHPNVEVRVRSVHSWDAPGLILDGVAQLALVSGPVVHPQIEQLASFTSPLVLVAGKQHPRSLRRFTLAELAQEQMLVSYWGPGSQAFLDRVRGAGEDRAGVWLELSPVELVKGMLLTGNGVSLVPEVAVRRELAAGDLIKLRLADSAVRLPMWEITLVRHRRPSSNPAAEALVETVRKVLPGLAR